MKKQLFWTLAGAALLLMTGCAPKYESLKPDQKRDFYERVVEEVEGHRNRGEFYEREGYLELAVAEYERANFYGAIAAVDPVKLGTLRAKIAKESQAAFYRGQNALKKKDYRRALLEYNAVMKLDPQFDDVAKKRDEMLVLPENAKPIGEKTDRLKTLLASPKPDAKEIEKLTTELLSYQHNHAVAYNYRINGYEEREREKREGRVHIRLGRHALAMDNLELAEAEFKKAQAIEATRKEGNQGLGDLRKRKDAIYLMTLAKKALAAKNDAQAEIQAKKAVAADGEYAPARALLSQITRDRARAESGERIKKGRDYLKQDRYLEALDEAQAILDADPDHAEAKALSADAQKALKNNIPRLLKEGEQFFDQNRFDESSQRFESVLSVDPDNNISQTYLKRIKSRMETLKMLER